MPPSYQQRIQKLQRFFARHKRLPSYSEMQEMFSLKSKNAVAKVVTKLVEEGYVTKDARGRLAPRKLLHGARVLGTIEAGWPSPAEEELADSISLDDFLIERKESSFLLRVSGKSMLGAGIHPGDMVIVERGRQAKSEDIVVAEVDGEWTLKYFRKHGNAVTLVPANAAFTPIKPKESLNVAGVVVGVIRKYQ